MHATLGRLLELSAQAIGMGAFGVHHTGYVSLGLAGTHFRLEGLAVGASAINAESTIVVLPTNRARAGLRPTPTA